MVQLDNCDGPWKKIQQVSKHQLRKPSEDIAKAATSATARSIILTFPVMVRCAPSRRFRRIPAHKLEYVCRWRAGGDSGKRARGEVEGVKEGC